MLSKSRCADRPFTPVGALQLLLVESEPSRVMNVVRLLETARPEWRVNVVRDRDAANRALSEASFDAVLLDVGGGRVDQIEPGALLAALETGVLEATRGSGRLCVAS